MVRARGAGVRLATLPLKYFVALYVRSTETRRDGTRILGSIASRTDTTVLRITYSVRRTAVTIPETEPRRAFVGAASGLGTQYSVRSTSVAVQPDIFPHARRKGRRRKSPPVRDHAPPGDGVARRVRRAVHRGLGVHPPVPRSRAVLGAPRARDVRGRDGGRARRLVRRHRALPASARHPDSAHRDRRTAEGPDRTEPRQLRRQQLPRARGDRAAARRDAAGRARGVVARRARASGASRPGDRRRASRARRSRFPTTSCARASTARSSDSSGTRRSRRCSAICSSSRRRTTGTRRCSTGSSRW